MSFRELLLYKIRLEHEGRVYETHAAGTTAARATSKAREYALKEYLLTHTKLDPKDQFCPKRSDFEVVALEKVPGEVIV